MYLFMIRHGETIGNVKLLFYGQQDLPLTENGRNQAMGLRPLMQNYSFDRVYSSDLSRAVETAKLVLPGCEPIQTPLLREFAMGSLDGLTFSEVLSKHGFFNGHYELFGGESPQDVCARLRTFLDELTANPCAYVAAFAHSGTMKCMLRIALGQDVITDNLQSTNCNVAVFRYIQGRWTLAAWNLARDLEGKTV